ncbi:MAG: trypsin-like peptidase domain-containing protein [Myxococcota bacterium]
MSDRVAAIALLATLSFFACAASAPSTKLEQRIVTVAEKIKPSVVHIEAIVKVNDRRSQATGSGVIVREDGAILTNDHVVNDAEKITVSIPGRKRKYPARLVGTDRQTDIALLQIQSDEPFPAAVLSEEDVRVGQWVLAIGNPYGLDGTVSLGIVSAKGRNLEIPDLLNDFIQTDAMIDRGSSGGPLVDLAGRVVGINSRGQGRGIGFTIPIDTARDVMAQLEAGGIERGFLGIMFQSVDRDLADHFGVADATGVLINHVLPGSPAEQAGLETGDIITRFDGRDVEAEEQEDLGSFQRLVARVAPGSEVEIRYLRSGETQRTKLVVGDQPALEGAEEESDFGFHVQEITPHLARTHRLTTTEGAFVTFVADGSPAREAGLRVGDVVVRVEETEVADLDGFREALDSVEASERFLLLARRGDELKFLLVKPAKRGRSDRDARP